MKYADPESRWYWTPRDTRWQTRLACALIFGAGLGCVLVLRAIVG